MAGISISSTILLLIILSSNLFITPTHQFSRKDTGPAGMNPIITTRFKFYFYDKVSTPNPTAITIVGRPPFFGSLVMIDDALLKSPSNTSKIIGRAQGMYGAADMTNTALLMVVNYVFNNATKYGGSSLSILGRNAVLQNKREMPIVGGTGLFRLAQGYALAHTISFDSKTGDAIVQYNVTVYHYGIPN